MSYRIYYEKDGQKQVQSRDQGNDLSGVILLLILLTTVCVYHFWPMGRAAIQTILWPDASDAAVETMNQMAGQMQKGFDIEALTKWFGEELRNAAIWK